jgi:nitrogen fixation protein FixH
MKTIVAVLLMAIASFAADKPDWKISMEPVGKVRCNYPAQINVRLEDAKGTPVDSAAVEVVLTMVDMDHGEFKTPAKMIEPGLYEAKPTFYMVGKWYVAVSAKKGEQAKTEKFTYDVKE